MDDQQHARELLAMCFDEWGFPTEASNVRDGEDLESYECDLRLLQQLRVFGLLRYPNEAAALRAAPEVIRIPAGDGLDPITAYADDLGEGRGRLTVCCYADSWSYTAAWGAMGGSLRSFIAGLNPHYLADNLLWPNAAKATKHQRQYVERIAAAVIAAFADRPQGVKDRPPIDGCTESNCKRCRTHPNHRGDMEHAGIGWRPVSPQEARNA